MRKIFTLLAMLTMASGMNAQVLNVYKGTTLVASYSSDEADRFVFVKAPDYSYVDLGLSVKWATCNVGAEKPEDYGDYFAWGETTGYNSGKTNFDWSTYKWCSGSYNAQTKYCTNASYGTVDGKTVLEPSDDAATANWGDNWRIPTQDEFQELIDNCTLVWTQLSGVNGYVVTSNKSGYTDKSIFLPAAGSRSSSYLFGTGSGGYYWTGSLSSELGDCAMRFYFNSDSHDMPAGYRSYGLSVRPVYNATAVKVTNIALSSTSVDIKEGATTTLTAVVSPENATTKTLEWTSDDASVATVDAKGVVTGVSEGTATITATATDGSGVSAACTVMVNPLHEYVDLGLSVKWATCNVGAEKPEDYGDYFAWGETIGYNGGKTDFGWSTYKWCNGSYNTQTKYCTDSYYGNERLTDGKTVLDADDDAATANWGAGWRMPTYDECQELIDNCTWTWTQVSGVNGYLVTSTKSGYTDKSIFLPAAGYRIDSFLGYADSYGYYWSNSIDTDYNDGAWGLNFGLNSHYMSGSYRFYGRSVRPVRTE